MENKEIDKAKNLIYKMSVVCQAFGLCMILTIGVIAGSTLPIIYSNVEPIIIIGLYIVSYYIFTFIVLFFRIRKK